mgnify:CR=1 FL=1
MEGVDVWGALRAALPADSGLRAGGVLPGADRGDGRRRDQLRVPLQGDPAAVGATLNYTLQTWPQTVSSTGTRGFFVDASMAIRHCTCGGAGCTADATDAPIEQMPVDC